MRALRDANGAKAWSGVLVSSAMGACVRSGMWEAAIALFDEHAADIAGGEAADSASSGVPQGDRMPDSFCFAAALAACRRGAQAERALKLLTQVEPRLRADLPKGQVGGRPGADVAVTTLAHMREQAVGACVAAGKYAEAIRCHQEAPTTPTVRSLVFALEACGALGLATGAGAEYASTAAALYALQPADGLLGPSDDEVDVALLSALASCGAWELLLRSFDGLGIKAKAKKECLALAAQAALALDSPRAAELASLAEKARG